MFCFIYRTQITKKKKMIKIIVKNQVSSDLGRKSVNVYDRF